MSIINVLDKSIFNRIAAGEVVERPASVVKELVENSIDAGADEIYINIVAGGKDLIEVFDNGHGIRKDDLKKAILPHATSKISKLEDLDNILTLGFRGEALPSISAVSKMKITSKTKDEEIGYSFFVEGGEPSEVEEISCNNGTYITVKNLFFNTPARQKFLKTDRSEENEVTDVVARLILGNPDISFKYEVNENLVYESFGEGIEDALVCVYGMEALKNSFSISNYKNGVNVKGYIGKHNFTKPSKSYQTVILNGRYIDNQTIKTAVHNAYAGYLMKRRYPFYVLYITMPSEVVDVNVTPNKSDVRFIDNSVVYGAIYSTVSKVLDGTDSALDIVTPANNVCIAPNVLKTKNLDYLKEEIVIVDSEKPVVEFKKYEKDTFGELFSGTSLHEDLNRVASQRQNREDILPENDIFAENKRYIEEQERKKRLAEQIQIPTEMNLRYVGQVLNSFLVFDDGKDMYVVDQHAAHERLLYNKLLFQTQHNELAIQPLLIPFTISINSVEYQHLLDKMPYFESLGIELALSCDELSISALPFILTDVDLKDFIYDVLNDYTLKNETIPEIVKEKLMQKACKSAVKAGMQLTEKEVTSLIRLLNGNINLKCPHGRPIAVKISRYEIDKWFKRIV